LFSTGNISVQGQIIAVSGQNGQGGEVDIESSTGNVVIAQTLDAHGIGTEGFGSILVSVAAGGDVSVNSMNVSGGSHGGAGEIDLSAGVPAGTLSISGDQLATGAAGVFFAVGGTINVNAQILTNGPSGSGADISINGCTVDVSSVVSNQSIPPGVGFITFTAG